MRSRLTGIVALAALGAAAAALIAVELGMGAAGYGEPELQDACTAEVAFPGDGLDATVQRIALSGLYGAACELGTSREELVLSFVPEAGTEPIPWDDEKIERAVRSGLLRAVDDAAARGSLGSLEAFILREVIERAPIDWLIDGGQALAGFAGDVAEALGDPEGSSLGERLEELGKSLGDRLLGELEDRLGDLLP